MEHQPQHEHLDPDETERFVSKLFEIVETGLAAARELQLPVDERTARGIALALAIARDETEKDTSPLLAFADSGVGEYETLRDAYLPLYADPDLHEDAKGWIDALGRYLLDRDQRLAFTPQGVPEPLLSTMLVHTQVRRPELGDKGIVVNVRADSSSEQVNAALQTAVELVGSYGDSFRAFLTLDDVNADAEPSTLETCYRESYQGSYASLADAHEAIAALNQSWILVAVGDTLHLFTTDTEPQPGGPV